MKTRSGETAPKRQKWKAINKIKRPKECYIDQLPEEVKCYILSYLGLADMSKMNYMSKAWHHAVERYLRYVTVLSFHEPGTELSSYASSMRDWELMALLSKCMMLERIKSFYPNEISQITKNPKVLTQSNITIALGSLPNLQTMDISDLNLMSELRAKIPTIEMPVFRNINGFYPREKKLPCQWLNCPKVIQEIELFGITVHHLPIGLRVTKLHLQNVKFKTGMTRDAGRTFMPNLKSFMMNDCVWPTADLEPTNMTLCAGLASCRHLEVLHLARSSIEGRLIKRIAEANWARCRPFSRLKKIVLAANWALHEDDIGALLVASQATLEKLYIQKSLTRDLVMQAIEIGGLQFPKLTTLKLGYANELSPRESNYISDEDEFQAGVVLDDRPCQLSDYGFKMVAKIFGTSPITSFSANDCPYLNSPSIWISDDVSFWEGLKELTLTHCPTANLVEFNKFLPKLRSLEILNLTGVFPSPPKGCSRVGLSAGMNIGGASGIRAIISQPPANPPNSLLSIPDVDIIEARELLRRGKLPDSDTDDTMEFADPSAGYRTTQVHSSCTATPYRIRRSRVRLRPHERELIGYASAEARKKALNLKKRMEREANEIQRKKKAASSALRRSRRVRDREINAYSLSDPAAAEDQQDTTHDLFSPITKPHLDNDNLTKEADGTDDEIVVPKDITSVPEEITKKVIDQKKPVPFVKTFTASYSGSGAETCDESDDDPRVYRCRACGSPFQEPSQLTQKLQFVEPKRKKSAQAGVWSKNVLCKKCIKKQCQAAKSISFMPSVDSLRPSKLAKDDVNKWLVFEASSGHTRFCSYNHNWKYTRCKLKGKGSLQVKNSHRHKVQKQQMCSLKHSAQAADPNTLDNQKANHYATKDNLRSHRDKSPWYPPSTYPVTPSLLTADKQTDISCSSTSKPVKRKLADSGNTADIPVKKVKAICTSDQETHTKDPFIEPDLDQVLRVEYASNRLTTINLTSCGVTKLSLTHAHSLVSVTAHACPVLRDIVLSSNPGIAPDIVRVTQCPKLSLPTLVSAFSHKIINTDLSASSCVRTIEYEPVDEFAREDTLIEMSLLPEVNKLLVECHELTGEDECIRLKAYYQNLLKDMTSSENAGYKSATEFKIYAEMHYGEKTLVSHNVPCCTTKLTPSCQHANRDCEIATAEGHRLQGGSLLCFVYPIDPSL